METIALGRPQQVGQWKGHRLMLAKYKVLDTLWFKIAFLSILFIAAYWVPIKGTVNTWFNSEDYSFGLIIPFISAYLIWDKRACLRDAPIKSYWIALPVLILSVILSLYGILGSSGNISRPLIPVLIILFTAFCFGKAVTRRLFFPFAFLIFMIPLPAFLERTLGVYLKSVSSNLGGSLISLCNIPVNVSGNVIDLGVTQLQVVDACSGLRYLFPLIALGLVYTYYFERVLWKKIFCVAATIPIAVLTNGLRIGITGILTNSYGPKVAEGFFHEFTGWGLFMASFAFLLLLGWTLKFLPTKMVPAGGAAEAPSEFTKGRVGNINISFLVSVALLLLVAALSWSTGALPPVKLQGGIAEFPLVFADWRGRSEVVDPEIVVKSGAEESFSGIYQNSKDEVISLYVGYRRTAFMENENFFHSPTVCLPSSGWNVIRTTTRKVSGVPSFPNLAVTEMVTENMGTKNIVYFWFQTKNQSTPDKNINRYHLAMHAIKRDNTYDLFIRPVMHVLPNENIEDAEKRLDQFIREMMGVMIPFLKERTR
jgi:exosortase D (VPLPA-CTERM-specific)